MIFIWIILQKSFIFSKNDMVFLKCFLKGLNFETIKSVFFDSILTEFQLKSNHHKYPII